jgi:hypothetical protein
MGWAGDAVEAFAARMNEPLRCRIRQQLERVGDDEITPGGAGRDTG